MKSKRPIDGEIIGPDAVSDDGSTPGDGAEEISDKDKEVANHKSFKKGRKGKDQQPRSDAEAEQEMRDRGAYAVAIFNGGFNWSSDEDDTRVPTEEEKRLVRTMSFSGFTQEQISAATKIPTKRLVKLFKWELENARILMTAEITGALAYRARMGSDTAAIFLLKTRGGSAFSEVRARNEAEAELDRNNPALEPTKQERQIFIDRIVKMVQDSVKSAEKTTEETKK